MAYQGTAIRDRIQEGLKIQQSRGIAGLLLDSDEDESEYEEVESEDESEKERE